MMKKKTALILALIMILAVVLSACGSTTTAKEPITKEALIGGYLKKTEQTKGMSYTMVMDMKMGISFMGQSQDMEMNYEMKVEATQDAAHIAGSVSTKAGDETESETTDIYSIKEGDGFDVYTIVDGEWYKTHADVNVDGNVQAMLAMQDTSSMQMTETDTEYIVEGTVSIADVFKAINNYVGGLGDMGLGLDLGSLDLSGVEPAKTTYHFDKATQEPTGVDIDMADCIKSLMQQLMSALVSSELGGDAGILSGMDLSSLIQINAERLTLSIKDIEFDKDVNITLPDAAKNAAEIPYDLINGDDDWNEYSWEAPEDRYAEEMKIGLPGDFWEETVDGYTKAYYDGSDIVMILREDKADFVNYADNMDEYIQLVLTANEARGIEEVVYENGRPTFEYDASADSVTYRYYTVIYESDEAYWLVQFACEKSEYDALKPYFKDWADTVMFAH